VQLWNPRSGVVALTAGLLATGIVAATPVSASDSLATKLHRLRVCESGDNYRADTGNGYYGAYQFSLRTWHGLGYKGRPDHAKPLMQNHAARKLHAQDGWRAWPGCARAEKL